MSDDGLKAIVADLHDFGYTAADIARVVCRSERRVGQILQEVKPSPPPLKSIDDLPHDLRQRVLHWLNLQNLKVAASCNS